MGMGIGTTQESSANKGGGGWLGGAIGAAGNIIGMIGQRKREKRAMKNQEHLMDIQQRNQQALNQQGHELQMKMWEDTNYSAQRAQMEKAGLNVGMMYGGSGAGGATTGSQGGGSAASGSAPAPQPMDISAINGAMTMAQMKLMEAQTKKTEAEAVKIAETDTQLGQAQIGEIGSRIEKIKAETQHEAVKQTLTQAEKYLKDVQYDKTMEEAVIASLDRAIKSGTWEDQMEGIKAEVARTLVDAELKKKGIELNEAQRKAVEEGVTQRWWEIGVKGVGTVINGVLGKGIIDKMGAKGKGGKVYETKYRSTE